MNRAAYLRLARLGGMIVTLMLLATEPLTATILSALVLGEIITPLQAAGSGIMLAALVAFQLWR